MLENRCNLVDVRVCVVYWVSDSVLVAAQPPPSPFSGGLHLSFPFFALPSSTPSGFAHIVNFFSFFSVDYFYFSNLWSCTATLPCALSFVSRRKRDQSGCISRKFSAIGAPCTETILQRSLSLFPSQGKGRSASLERDPFFYFFVACILKFQGPLIITTQYCYSSYSLATGIENVRWGSEKEANNMNSQEREGESHWCDTSTLLGAGFSSILLVLLSLHRLAHIQLRQSFSNGPQRLPFCKLLMGER